MSWGLYAAGWALGWLLLWSTRRLPRGGGRDRPAVAVVVPARNEAHALAGAVGPLVAQLRDGDELLVVDDHSADGTALLAAALGARVVPAPELPVGWIGKPHACLIGARATIAPRLMFVDADVRPGPTLIDDVAAAVHRDPGAVSSVQPWHEAERPGERVVLLANVVTLMGSAAFTVLGDRLRPTVAFGPVVAVDRGTYDAVGGHGHPLVRGSLTEDIALARVIARSHVFSDRRDATFRMHPRGLREALGGWSRTMAAGIAATRWWVMLAVVAWVWSLAGAAFVGWLAYVASAAQVWVLGRRAGRVGPVLAAIYPLMVIVLVVIIARAAWLRVAGRTTWKGRPVRAA